MAENAWSIPLDLVAKRMGIDLTTVARKITFDLMRDVILRSPVDTGRFRANWNVTYGAPNYITTEDTTQSRGFSEAAKALTFKLGGVIYMSNGLPYAQKLEYGWSKQAPRGMLRLATQQIRYWALSRVTIG